MNQGIAIRLVKKELVRARGKFAAFNNGHEGYAVVLEELERGYLRHGRLLRPSKVKVSKGKRQTEEETS